MAAIDEMPVARLSSATASNDIKKIINVMFWSWYVANQNLKVVTVKWLFISKTLYVRDLKVLFELLVGPEPSV